MAEAQTGSAPAAPAPASQEVPAEAAGEAEKPLAPIVVKKIIDGHGGAHGGAWKIALADMMTAMMAFFLLMWLLGASNEDKRRSVAEYFKPSASHSLVDIGKRAGSDGMLGGASIIDPEAFRYAPKQTAMLERVTPRSEGGPTENDPSPKPNDPERQAEAERQRAAAQAEQAAFDKLENEIRDKLAQNKRLESVREQVQFVREKDGLRIEIIDKADFAMFGLGTSQLLPRAQALVDEVAASLSKMPNKLALRGHTDSLAFAAGQERTNWSLSAERSESTRQALQRRGVAEDRFARIEGVADTAPYNPRNPTDPRNRRISITVLNQSN